jgi:hypothetical protein
MLHRFSNMSIYIHRTYALRVGDRIADSVNRGPFAFYVTIRPSGVERPMKNNRLAVLIFLIPMAVWSMGSSDSEQTDNIGIEPAQEQPRQDDLLTLAGSGNAAGVESLLKVDVDLNQTDENGRSALHAVAESGNADIAAILLSRGISIDIQDKNGKTPLLLAVESSSIDVIELLADAGADIGLTDSSGQTPASAAMMKSTEVLAALVNEDNIDSSSVSGKPLLHAAAATGRTAMLTVLLSEGADPMTQDSRGLTALDEALSASVGIAQGPMRRIAAPKRFTDSEGSFVVVYRRAPSNRQSGDSLRLRFHGAAPCLGKWA